MYFVVENDEDAVVHPIEMQEIEEQTVKQPIAISKESSKQLSSTAEVAYYFQGVLSCSKIRHHAG